MSDKIGQKELQEMLFGSVGKIRDNEKVLTKLDCDIGDGDHGVVMLKVMGNISESLQHGEKNRSMKDLMFDAGMAASSTDGGSSAPLIGSLFLGMSEGLAGKESLAADDVAKVVKSGIEAVQLDSKAQIGDKTMMDALLPLLDIINTDHPKNIKELLESFAHATLAGAESTKDFTAKFGRARFLGDRVIGHLDPGAKSIAFIFEGFLKPFTE